MTIDARTMKYRATCPEGHELRGTLETIKGIAYAKAVVVQPGTIEPEYEGETDVDWDSQRPTMEHGQRLWECVERDVYRELQLLIIEEELDRGEEGLVTMIEVLP